MLPLDPETFLDAANQLKSIRAYPILVLSHCVVTFLAIKDDLGPNAVIFSRKHPFALWIACMFSCFSGGMIANLLMGETMLAPLVDMKPVTLATVVWYLVFYSPFDISYKVMRITPVRAIFMILKELDRARKCYEGVLQASHVFYNGYLIWIILGTIRGAGGNLFSFVERFIRGTWSPNINELLTPSFATKTSIIAAVVFTLDRRTDVIDVPSALVYLGVVIFLVYFRLAMILLHIGDPFVPFENMFCSVFMGGIWDAFNKALDSTSLGKSSVETSVQKDLKKE